MALQQIGLQAVLEDADFQKGIKGFEQGVQDAGKSTEHAAGMFSKLGDAAKVTVVAGLAAAAVGFGGLIAAAKGGVDALGKWNDQVNTLSDNLGTSGKESSKWAVAFNHVGLSVDEGGAGLNFFTKQLAALGKEAPKTTTTVKDNSGAITKLNEQLEKAQTRLQRATEKLQDAKNPTKAMQYAVEDAQKAVTDLNEKLASTPASIESVSSSTPKLTPFAEALQRLGIEAKDSQGNLKSFDQVMPELLDAFQNLPPGIDKSALAMELFGTRAGTKFLDFLSQGSEGLKQAEQFARDFGLELETDASNAIEEFGFIMNDLNLGFQGFLITIGKEAMPMLRGLAQYILQNVLPTLIDWAKDVLPRVGAAIQDVAKTVLPFIEGLGELAGQIAGVLTTGELFEDFGADFAALFGENEKTVKGFMTVLGNFFNYLYTVFIKSTTVIRDFWTNIQPTLANLKEWFETDGVDALETFYKKAREMKSVQTQWDLLLKEMEKSFKHFAASIQSDAEVTFPTLAQIIGAAMDRINQDMSEKLFILRHAFSAINAAIEKDWERFWTKDIPVLITGAWIQILNSVGLNGAQLVMVMQATMDSVVIALKDMHDAFFTEGGALVQAIIDGIGSMGGAINAALTDLLQNAVDSVLGWLGGGVGANNFTPNLGRNETAAALNAGLSAGRSVPSARPASFNQGLAAGALQTIQIYFQGSGGPANQAEAETQGGWIVNAMAARGIRF